MRRLAGGLGPRRLGGPVRDEGVVGSGELAQGGGLAGERLIGPPADAPSKMPATWASRSARPAARSRSSLTAAACSSAVEVAPLGAVPGGSGELGDQEPVSSRDETILVHLSRIERASGDLKQAGGLSRQSRSEVAVGSNGRCRGGGSPSHRSHRRPERGTCTGGRTESLTTRQHSIWRASSCRAMWSPLDPGGQPDQACPAERPSPPTQAGTRVLGGSGNGDACRASAILARAQRREVRPNIWASRDFDSGLPGTLSRYAATPPRHDQRWPPAPHRHAARGRARATARRADRRPPRRVWACRARSLRSARRRWLEPERMHCGTAGRIFAVVHCRRPACCRPGGADEPDQKLVRADEVITAGEAATTAPTRPWDQPWAMSAVRVAAMPSASSQRAREGTGTRCRAAYSTTIELA